MQFIWSFATRFILRMPLRSFSCTFALALATALINIVPQLRSAIQQELEQPGGYDKPTLFLFDIQEPQVQPLIEQLESQGLRLNNVSAMIQTRILAVNDQPFKKQIEVLESNLREEQVASRFRNRTANLSYRGELYASESIVRGKFFPPRYLPGQQQLPEISVEERYAQRLGWKIGDKITFDVHGLEVLGKITSLRKVRWSTFEPNFFILFQPGVVEMAPKTLLATVSVQGRQTKLNLQYTIVHTFPNVSIVDVQRVVNKIENLVSQMSLALLWMAYLTFFAGMVVLLSILRYQLYESRYDIALLKTLGATFGQILATMIRQFLLLATYAVWVGVGLSLAISYTLSWLLFDQLWSLDWKPLGITLLCLPSAVAFMTLVTIWRTLRLPAQRLLQESR